MILQQTLSAYKYYIGFYGVCDGNTCEDYILSSESKIRKVYKISQNGISSYIHDSLFQGFDKLECGNCYLIILYPGDSTVGVPGFVVGNILPNYLLSKSCTNSKLSNYQIPKSDAVKIYLCWYGMCQYGINAEYDLTSNDKILSAYLTTDTKIKSYNKGALSDFQGFTKLKAGNAYLIAVDKSDSDIVIPNLYYDNTSSENILLSENCEIITPTPTNTKTETITPLGPEITPTPDDVILLEPDLVIPVLLLNWEWYEDGEIKSLKFDKDDFIFNDEIRKVNLNDLENLLNSRNYCHPNIDEKYKPSGSIMDYFYSISCEEIVVQFKILPAGNDTNPLSNNLDDYAYTIQNHYKYCGSRIQETSRSQWELPTQIQLAHSKARRNVYTNSRKFVEREYTNMPFLVFHAGYSAAVGSSYYISHDYIWSQRFSIKDANNNLLQIAIQNIKYAKKDKNNVVRSEIEPVGVAIHELIHTFNIRDYYQSNRVAHGVNRLAIMSTGFWGVENSKINKYYPGLPLGYTREILSNNNMVRGIKLRDIKRSEYNIRLKPVLESGDMIKVYHPLTKDVWFIEYRSGTSNNKNTINFDKFIPEEGLCITHKAEVTTAFDGSTHRSDNRDAVPKSRRGESGYMVSIEQSDGLFESQLQYKYSNNDIKNDLYKPGNEFSPYTLPSTISRSGIPSGICIKNIRKLNDTEMVFDVEFIQEPRNKIIGIEYNFMDKSKNPLSTESIIFQKYSVSNVEINIKTYYIADGTKIGLKINPTPSQTAFHAEGRVINNNCKINLSGSYFSFMLNKQYNIISFSVDKNNLQFSNTFHWNDYIIIK